MKFAGYHTDEVENWLINFGTLLFSKRLRQSNVFPHHM